MSHEQSETEERDGKFYNVYGKSTPKAGQVLPGEPAYDTLDSAVTAARDRSERYGRHHHMGDLLDLLKALRLEYDNNLPAGGPGKRPVDARRPEEGPVREEVPAGALEDSADAGMDQPYMGPTPMGGQLRRVAPVQDRGALDQAERLSFPGHRSAPASGGAGPSFPRRVGVDGDPRVSEAHPGFADEYALGGDPEGEATQQRVRQLLTGDNEGSETRRALRTPNPRNNPVATAREAIDPKLIKTQWTEYNPEDQDEADAIDEIKAASERGERKTIKVMNPGAKLARAQDAGVEPDEGSMKRVNGALDDPTQRGTSPRKSLAEAFKKRVDETEAKIGRDLNDQEKGELQMDFFLRLMASSGTRGAGLIENVGRAGLGTGEQYRGLQERKRRDRREGRDDAFREIALEDKDQDNQRLDRREAREDRKDQQRINLLRDQIQQGKFEIKTGGRGGNFILIDKKTGKVTDTGIKASDSAHTTKPGALQILEHLKANPEDAEQLLKIMKVDQGEKEESKLLELAGKIRANDLTGKMTASDAVRQAKEMLNEIRRPEAVGGGPQRFDTPAALEAAIKSGKVKKGDKVITPQGERIVK